MGGEVGVRGGCGWREMVGRDKWSASRGRRKQAVGATLHPGSGRQ